MIDFRVPTAAEIRAAQSEAIEAANRVIDGMLAVPAGQRTFANTILPLEEAADLIERAHGRYGFMSYVAEDAEVRAAADVLREELEKFEIELGFREDVYRAVQEFARTPEAASLTGEDKRFLEFTLRDYRRDGFDLPADQRQRVKELKNRLVELGVEFQRNIDTYDDAILVTREELIGLPEAYISRLRTEQQDGETLYRVSLDYPELHPFLDNAEIEELRRELLVKSLRRGGEANIPILEEAIAIRDEAARLLGYDSWAAYVLEVRMAKRPEAVREFLTDLRQKIEAKRVRDMEGLLAAKREHTRSEDANLHIWDWRFYHNYLLKTRYAVDDFEVAKYFPLDAVLKGLFDVYQTVFGVRFEAVEPANAWHPDVRLYRILDAESGEEIAHFYMDLFPRPNKYGHAAAFTLVGGRSLNGGGYQKPVSAIVANFTKPTPQEPSLLRHTEVETLFHEFGHILHQTLTKASRLRFSGTRTERDFVEAPSQMLEHWVWSAEVLAGFSRHVETGEPLPKDLLGRMIEAKNLDSAVFCARQLFFGELDYAYHSGGARKHTTAIAAELHQITGFPMPEGTYFQAGFGHLFGYDAGYYGYKWSEVFADDMFTRFEANPLDPAIGLDYRRKVLERGGSVDGDVLVREFLGREPNTDAFLRNMGL
ncbi:MAG TPA: M3 family metallopeptidase [Dehalococcoidia bacterium]|nr:M3 family metallopeptidase [Dehalococcoidia bacterium]